MDSTQGPPVDPIRILEAAGFAKSAEELRGHLQELARLRRALDPLRWTREMSDAWHKALGDVRLPGGGGLYDAFAALREAALREG